MYLPTRLGTEKRGFSAHFARRASSSSVMFAVFNQTREFPQVKNMSNMWHINRYRRLSCTHVRHIDTCQTIGNPKGLLGWQVSVEQLGKCGSIKWPLKSPLSNDRENLTLLWQQGWDSKFEADEMHIYDYKTTMVLVYSWPWQNTLGHNQSPKPFRLAWVASSFQLNNAMSGLGLWCNGGDPVCQGLK